MALGVSEKLSGDILLIGPMIDARRMEVFTAVYSKSLEELVPVSAMILDENSFHDLLKTNKILFTGSGSAKWQKSINGSPYAFFEPIPFSCFLFINYFSPKICSR